MTEEMEPKKPALPLAVAVCQVCGQPLAAAPVVLCRKCRTPHHRECWRYNRGCAVYGCQSRIFETPSPDHGEPATTFTLMQPPPSSGRFVVFLVAAILSLIFGLFLSVRISPWFAFPTVLAYVSLLGGTIAYQIGARYRLTFDRATGTARRQLVFRDRAIFEEDPAWLLASDVAEVHLHRFVVHQFRIQRLYVALDDGRRVFIQEARGLSGSPWDSELEAIAEQLARFGDTTVRFIEGSRAPTREEIAEATAQKALGRDQPASLPGPDDPPG